MKTILSLIAALLALLLPGAASADELRPGYIEFSEVSPGVWSLTWKAPRNAGIGPETQPILPAGCTPSGTPQREPLGMATITRMDIRCTGPVAGGTIGLSNFSGSRTDVLARVKPIDAPMQALRLTAVEPMGEIATQPGSGQVFLTYLSIGVDHIVFGFDHLLFVISLVLLVQSWRRVAIAVTAFTVSHSITLVATSLGYIGLPQRPVEALIALSILLLAVEIVNRDPDRPSFTERYTWVVAFAFGLLHGFGFAGALREIGLPESDLGLALLGFNLGVEAGQLLVVVATLAIIALIHRLAKGQTQRIIRFAAYPIGIISSAWLFERTVL